MQRRLDALPFPTDCLFPQPVSALDRAGGGQIWDQVERTDCRG